MAILIMKAEGGFYPIYASGTKPLKEEAGEHGKLNDHILSVEDIDGNVLWRRVKDKSGVDINV